MKKSPNQQKIEHIKDDAKQYYKGKNMIFRYVLIGFLLILLILQFLLPGNNKDDIENLESSNQTLESIDDSSQETNTELSQSNTTKYTYNFLDQDIISEFSDIQKYLDHEIVSITSSIPELTILYKKSLSFLPQLAQDLQKADIPSDFQYLSLTNGLNNPVWMLPGEAMNIYELIEDGEIDERFNTKKSTDVTIEYLGELYNIFGDWNLVLIGYLMGGDQLEIIIQEQGQTEFNDLYVEPYILNWYYNIMAYKHVMENISDYIDIPTDGIEPYFQPDTIIVKLGETKDLIKRAKKEGYTFKEIKELNPWILGDSLPKGKREIQIYSK